MATEAKSTNYWISSTALYIQLNAMGESNYIQCSVVSGASVLCYMSDVPGLGYDAGHNYQRWTLAAYPSIFPDSARKYVYIAIPRQSTTDNNQATVVFPGEKIDIYGKTIPSSGTEGVQIGNEAYYYIFTGGIISAVKTDADNTRKREWEQHFDCGKLATDEAIASGGEGEWWRYNSVSDTITFLKEILKANFNELSAKVARVTSLFLGGHELKGVADSNGTLETSNDTVVTPQYLGQFGVKHFLAKDKDDTAYGTITWEKVQKFLQGLHVGNSNNENGGSWTTDAEGRSHLNTDYLEVRMKAIFEELVINKTSTIGGKEIISPAGGVVAHKVEEVTVTYNNVSQKAYRCYFLAEQDGDEVDNDFAVNDQVRSESFNVRKGTYHKAGNHFYWRLVIGRDEDPVELEGKKYHYIDLSDTDCATASDVPAKGDVLNQCGNRTDVERQNCLIFSAVDTYSPSISLYHGINSYSFANREYVEYGVNKQTNKAFFNVYGDMYVGDRPTKENGYEGSSYIRYDSSTKQVSVKGKISAKSTVDGKELSQYIKENTDDTVANAAIKAAEDAQKAAQNAQKDITILGNTVTGNKKEFDNYVTNGYLEPSEIAAMAQDSKRLEDDFAAAQKSYNEVKEAEVLANTNELIDLKTAFDTLTTAKTELVTYLSDISARYNAANTEKKATIVSAVGTKFTNFQSAYSAFYDKLGLANAYITSKIYGDLGVVIGDVTSLAYLKKALMDAPDTEINGGLVLTSLIGLRDTGGNTTAGINGITEKSAKGGGIAAWFGGEMVDKDYNDGSKTPANTIFRFDGSGYVAGGAIWWGTDGRVHADPTSFIISEKNLGAYLTFFEPTWKAGSAGTSVADLVSLKPNAPFSKLGVSGDATFEGTISFHGIKLTYDSKNKAIKIDGNLYTTGGITAYGAGASTTGGGGLIASVISYARIIEGSYTDADLTSIPNAYAIKALSSRIDNIATELGGLNLSWNNITGKPSTFTPSAHTHKWADITDRITKVSQLTNDAGYLTTHQSLASYYTKTEIDAKGYTTNKGTVTSVSLTLPTGLTCATKTITTSGTFAITLASGYSIPTTAKQTAWDGAVSAKHTHSNKSVLDGITSAKVTHWDSAYDWYALMTTDEETADGIINKWNEVVSFLANIAQTDTLSGIVDGINKSISDEVTRAKKAEGVNASGISTNKTSITTLQGYFTSGSAKKALQLTNARKLWGNSFNGTADINGSIIVPSGKYISIGNIKLEYDATNKALKITNTTTDEVANLYTSGGVSAYGVGTSPSSGGGLNGTVKAYADAIKLTAENLSEIASAYSIKALDSRISSLEGGSATSISVSGSGNAVTSITKNGTTISVVKGSTFLISHQSLDGYVNAIAVSGSGNAVTAVTKSGKTITFTKGATFLTSHQSLAAYLTKSEASSTYQPKGNYLTSHQSLADYAKKTDIPTSLKSPNSLSWSGYNTGSYDGSSPKSFVIPSNTNQLTNGAGFITSSASISGNAATATKVNHSLLVFGKSFNGSADVTVADTDLIASISTGTSNVTDKTEILTSYASDNGFNDSNAKNKIHRRPASAIWGYINSKTISNADKLDNVHLNGIFTALSNTNNGVSMTIGTVAKSLANMQVYSATKLVTARNISIAGRDFVGNVNFDGTGNVSLNGAINYCTINIGNTDPNPFKRIAHIKVAHSWNDNALLLYISQGYNGGNFGLCRVEFRTNDIANSDTAGGSVSLRWLIRQGYATDSIQAGYYIHLKNAYVDVFLKTTGAYQGTVIRVIQDSRGSINNSFGLINSTYNTEAYTSLSAAATALYNVAYQGTVSGTDTCTVSHANSATKLQTARTIWGQSFDGTGNVNGTLQIERASNFGSYNEGIRIVGTSSEWCVIMLGCKAGSHSGVIDSQWELMKTAFDTFRIGRGSSSSSFLEITKAGNVGIGTTSPAYKFHVAGQIYSKESIRTAAQNQAIKLSNDANPAWISALDGQVIFNTGKAIRFGETAWDWNQWAGLKYTHSNKTIYLGIADGSAFNANTPQLDGTLRLAGIKTITPDSGARIGGSGGDLYLGNANNSNWVKVQDICSHNGSNYWYIYQNGNAHFNNINVNNINVKESTIINGETTINSLLTAKAIKATTADVNAFGTRVQNWDGSIGANVTNMFNGIPQGNIQVEYSIDNGASWNTYPGNPESRFNLVNDNAGVFNYFLGDNDMLGDTNADILAQIKKNQLRVTVKIPDEIYQELSWISVDVNNGVDIKCQVYFGSSTGGYKEYVSKIINGWAHKCDICVGPLGVNVGNDTYRYVRLVFSHPSNNTNLRNGIVAKIRALALTKYIYNGDRYTINTTGHIYDYDAYMNTYFPNSILAKGGVTAYQSSDIRLKQDLRKLDYFGIIKAMGGTFGFAWKKDNTRSIGWIAQHVLCNPHLKDIVETDEKGYYKINYWSPKLIATAFGAIEQVGDEVSRLKARVVFLESEVLRLSGDKEDCNKKRLDNKNINLLN